MYNRYMCKCIIDICVNVISYQHKLIKMRAKLANINHCAVPLLSRAAVNLCWYYYTFTPGLTILSPTVPAFGIHTSAQ